MSPNKFKTPEFRKRVATGLSGVAAILLLIFFGGRFGIGLISAVVTLGMLYEFSGMLYSLEEDRKEKRWVLMGLGWILFLSNFLGVGADFGSIIFGFFALSAYYLFGCTRHDDPVRFERHFLELCGSILALLYLPGFMSFLVRLHGVAYGPQWVVLFLLVVWGTDTGGYFVGLKYGRTKLFPRVSPKKTIEGSLGGMALALTAALVFRALFFREAGLFSTIVISLMVSPISMVGDLFESFLKRAFNTKDSGNLLPGHGGFLDRFDGMVFSLPLMYSCVKIFGL